MHTVMIMNSDDSWAYMTTIARMAARQYNRACYISFNKRYDFVIDLLERASLGKEFFVIDSSPKAKEMKSISKTTYVIPVEELFKVYLFLRKLIIKHKVDYIMIDSLSALIRYHGELPLKDMMTNLILEIGRWGVDSTITVESIHRDHPVVKHLEPLITRQLDI
ncbi:hypothetical protein GOV07_05585 [Candidatus Woesearchaeota archaeon]|nr:hypothetical protein [Candidatus Woesearchaeota archaeon]